MNSKIVFLTNSFYKDHPNPPFKEMEQKQNRPYIVFLVANPHSECNRILRGSRPGATYDDACEDMHHWRHHGRLQPS